MRTQNFTAIVLRKRPFTERDVILSILTEEGIHLQAQVKGFQTEKSKRRAHLQNLNLVKGVIYHGKTRPHIQSIQCINSFTDLKEDYDALMRIQVLVEVLAKSLAPDDPHPELFTLLKSTLEELNQAEPNLLLCEAALIQASHHLGFLPSFRACGHCHTKLETDDARWSDEEGLLTCEKCNQGNDNPILILKYRKAIEFFRSARIHDASKVNIQKEELSALKSLMTGLLNRKLDYKLKTLI